MTGDYFQVIMPFYRTKIRPKMTFLAQNGGKLTPQVLFFPFFVYFSPVNSPDRWAWMPGDYYHVIMPFYRTKNDVFWPKIW